MKDMCLVTPFSSPIRFGGTYRVGKDVHLCKLIKSNRLAVSTELGKVMFPASHRLDSRCVFLGWVWIFVKLCGIIRLRESKAVSLGGYSIKSGNWRVRIYHPQGQTTPINNLMFC